MRPVSQPRPVLHPGPARRPRFPSHVEAATGYLRARGVRTVAEFDSLPQAELEAHLRARFGGVRLPYVRSGMVSPRQVQDVLARCDKLLLVAADGRELACDPTVEAVMVHLNEPESVEVAQGALGAAGALEAALDALEEDPARSILQRGALEAKVRAALVLGVEVAGWRVVALQRKKLTY